MSNLLAFLLVSGLLLVLKTLIYPTERISEHIKELRQSLHIIKAQAQSGRATKSEALTLGFRALEDHHKNIVTRMNSWFNEHGLPPVDPAKHETFETRMKNAKRDWAGIVNDFM